MSLFKLKGVGPKVAADAYVAPGATVIGNVTLEADSSVWPGAVVRADNDAIEVGAGSNVQDGAVLHTDTGFVLRLGRGVSVGHLAMLHGCTVEDDVLIGIQAIVLNGARIGAGSLIGAGALVTAGTVIPERSMVLGSPAKVVRPLSEEESARVRRAAESYVLRSTVYREELVEERLDSAHQAFLARSSGA